MGTVSLQVRVDLGELAMKGFSNMSIFVGYLMPKPSLLEQQWYYLTHSWGDKRVHTFPKGICQKVNVIAQLEFKFAYEVTVQCISHYATGTLPAIKGYFTLLRFPELEPHHQMQFGFYPFVGKYSQHILNSTDKLLFWIFSLIFGSFLKKKFF